MDSIEWQSIKQLLLINRMIVSSTNGVEEIAFDQNIYIKVNSWFPVHRLQNSGNCLFSIPNVCTLSYTAHIHGWQMFGWFG